MGLAAGHAGIPRSHHPSGAPQAATDLISVVFISGSLGTASSTITSAHSPWQRMARAKQFASRIAKSFDQKGVIMRSSIRMAQPCCSLTTLKVIITFHREWAATSSVFRYLTTAGRLKTADSSTFNNTEDQRELIHIKRFPTAPVPECLSEEFLNHMNHL